MSYLIEDVTIPHVLDPPPVSCRLVRWLVRDGERVCMYQSIYELEIDETLVVVESFHTGHMKQLIADGTSGKIGDRIATIVVDEISKNFRTFPLYLSGQEIAIVDSLRGESLREIFIRETFLRAIGIDPETRKSAMEETD